MQKKKAVTKNITYLSKQLESKNKKKFLMTGGHAASSALVVAEEIRSQKLPWEIFWIGFNVSFEGAKISSLPTIYFPNYGIKTYSLYTGRLQRKLTPYSISSLLKIPFGFFHAFFLLLKIKPHLILSFGGFSAFPVVVVGYILGIPVLIHEQTAVVGRANKYSSFFAKKIAISRETSREYFPPDKTVLVGNPVPREIVSGQKSKTKIGKKTLFITGGQSGAEAINSAVIKVLPDLLEKFNIIHLTGLKDEEKFRRIKLKLTPSNSKNYRVYGIVDPNKYNILFNSSDIILSRAGANTVSKIIISEKPSLLIPLPISYLDEQKKNALYAKRFVHVMIIPQEKLSSSKLLNSLGYLAEKHVTTNKLGFHHKNPDVDAAKRIVKLIKTHIK